MKPGRNDPCRCGSGKKYKHCCGNMAAPAPAQTAQPSAIEQNRLITLYQAGRLAELENQANLLLNRYPNSGFGWKILSAALSMQGKDSLSAWQKAAMLLPQDAEVQNNYGDMLAKHEKLTEARECFTKAIELKPHYIDAQYNLGQVLMRLEQYPEAASCFKRTIRLAPNNTDAHINLATTLQMLGLHSTAETQIEIALKINPGMPEANKSMGSLLAEQGKFEQAQMYFQRALDANPDYLSPRLALANLAKIEKGDPNFESLIASERKIRDGDKIAAMDDLIALYFALGKGFDDLGEYDRAFESYANGCRLKRSTFDYAPEETSKTFVNIATSFPKERIAALSGQGCSSQVPIFIVGMPRSGTTLVEQIIASHPDVHGAGELHYLQSISRSTVSGKPFPENLSLLSGETLTEWGDEYVARLCKHAPGARRITDKMPQNFESVGLIHLILPNAKIIHVKRNPIDTCLSCFTHLFAGRNLKFSYELHELGRFYKDYSRLMEHWRETLPEGAFLEVEYEEVVADLEAQAKLILEYCDLPWHPGCLDFHKTERSVRTASITQVRQPIYRTSMERWRRYERHLTPLISTLKMNSI